MPNVGALWQKFIDIRRVWAGKIIKWDTFFFFFVKEKALALAKKTKLCCWLLFFLRVNRRFVSLRRRGVSSCATRKIHRAFMAHLLSQMSSWVCHETSGKRKKKKTTLKLLMRRRRAPLTRRRSSQPFRRWLPPHMKRFSAPPLCLREDA